MLLRWRAQSAGLWETDLKILVIWGSVRFMPERLRCWRFGSSIN